MGVIFDGIDEGGSAAEVLQDGGHVGVQGAANRVGDDGFTIFGAEDEVNVEAGQGLGHRFGRPFRALGVLLRASPGRCPGLAWAAPLGWKTLADGFLIAVSFITAPLRLCSGAA